MWLPVKWRRRSTKARPRAQDMLGNGTPFSEASSTVTRLIVQLKKECKLG